MTNTSRLLDRPLRVGRTARLAFLGALACAGFAALAGMVADSRWTLDDSTAAGMIFVMSGYGVSRVLDFALTALAMRAKRHMDGKEPRRASIQFGARTERIIGFALNVTILLVQLGTALLVASAGLALAAMDPVQWFAFKWALVLLAAAIATPALVMVCLVLVYGWPMWALALLYVCLHGADLVTRELDLVSRGFFPAGIRRGHV